MEHHAQRDAELLAAYPPGKCPIIDRAERAIRAFYIDGREQAEQALATWQHTPALTRRERAAVLARFGGAS